MKKNGLYLVAPVIALMLASGCVSSSKYKNLEAEHETQKVELATTQAKVSELKGRLGIANTEKSQLQGEKTQLQGSVNEMKTALEQARKRRQETEKRLAEFKELTSKFSKLVNSGKLSVKMVQGRMTVALSTDILFSSGSAKLSTEGAAAIKEVNELLKSLEGRKFQIEGHSDNIPMKSAQFPSNWELASARAITVLKTMVDAGMPANQISGATYGDTQPIADNATPEGKKLNRRIAIVIVPDLSGLPGNEEIEKMVAPDAPATPVAAPAAK
ncbi:MAG: OmpA family protein [Bdellovibrio sp.]|nr:OmpA family protein [Bdellovibrio sp.]